MLESTLGQLRNCANLKIRKSGAKSMMAAKFLEKTHNSVFQSCTRIPKLMASATLL
jgi:hypothetical protein